MPVPSPFPQHLLLSDFSYELPDEKVARYPLAERDQSRLLVWRKGIMEDSQFRYLADFLPSPALLVFNNSRVVEARILFQKPSGGLIEIFCLEPGKDHPNIPLAMIQTRKVLWNCLIGGASKWKQGQVLVKQSGQTRLEARFIEKRAYDFLIEFSWTPADRPFGEVLHLVGSIPLPPYLKRPADKADEERYQTVYAQEAGSVAAPTAGLHFTKALLNELAVKKIQPLYLTLHVGAGTFMPVKNENISRHLMHEEFIEVGAKTLGTLISKIHEPIVAVGTTSLRTLETLYWLGLKVSKDKTIRADALSLQQYEPYELNAEISVKDALEHLLKWIELLPEKKMVTKTQLFIVPGYPFKIVRGLVTNFHQPKSTLLLLVAALVGPSWKSVYALALDRDYRFLSYGDACLFLT
ncbi:MAG TPA: S-adenosylmethionine:tRNA ribosyltransferase-isomerase [Puia sp.]